ncbi:MAG: HAMP domain-containing sensor histidine kinase [Myxococcota bacterium]
MRPRRNLKSLSTPIALGAVSVPLSVALMVGWIVLLARNLSSQQSVALNVSLLVLGAVSFAVICTVLVLLSFYLGREILEVRRQDGFIDSVTHELKSPLASIQLLLETMARPELPEAKREELRLMMLEDVERLSSFIDDVLQTSVLATGKDPTYATTELRLRPLVEELSRALLRRHKRRREDIRLEVPEGLRVVTDRAALGIVIKNLVDNALKYGGEAPVRVAAETDAKGRLVLRVEDEGIGLTKEQTKRVFQRFYRVERESVRSRKGTGLGLFVVGAIVRSLGGRVRAESAGVGLGSTFVVELPIGSVGAPASAPSPSLREAER